VSLVKSILLRAFGRPQGILGILGGIIMARTNSDMAARTIELLDVQRNDRVLEIGFGPGVGIELLLTRVSFKRIAGVDYSAEMVRAASVRNANAIKAGRVELTRASVESLPFVSESFDKALAINSNAGLARCRGGTARSTTGPDTRWHDCARLYAPFGATAGEGNGDPRRGGVHQRARRGYGSGFLCPGNQTMTRNEDEVLASLSEAVPNDKLFNLPPIITALRCRET
jgi:SAM-dependent methyltransferase